jgi:hypothetical protein
LEIGNASARPLKPAWPIFDFRKLGQSNIFSGCPLAVNKQASVERSAVNGLRSGARSEASSVTQTRTRIKGKPCFACSREGMEKAFTHFSRERPINSLFSRSLKLALDNLGIPE